MPKSLETQITELISCWRAYAEGHTSAVGPDSPVTEAYEACSNQLEQIVQEYYRNEYSEFEKGSE
jgi:hypothetical protein